MTDHSIGFPDAASLWVSWQGSGAPVIGCTNGFIAPAAWTANAGKVYFNAAPPSGGAITLTVQANNGGLPGTHLQSVPVTPPASYPNWVTVPITPVAMAAGVPLWIGYGASNGKFQTFNFAPPRMAADGSGLKIAALDGAHYPGYSEWNNTFVDDPDPANWVFGVDIVASDSGGGGGGGGNVAVDDMTLIGTFYAKGTAQPPMSKSVQRHLERRGKLGVPGLTCRRAFNDRGNVYAAGAAYPAAQPSVVLRRLLMGRYVS